MNPIFIEQFGDEGLERSLDKIEKELLEKMENFNKQFETYIQPDNGFYGISEIVKPDGIVEKIYKNSDGLYNKQYFKDNKLIKSREQIEKGNWKLLLYDDNGIEYLEKIYEKGEKGLQKTSERLLPDKVIKKGNFTTITDSQGRIISSKVTDLSINKNGRGSISVDIEGKGYLSNDHRAHLIPDIFKGKGTLENIVPQLDSINQGKVKQVENIARKLKEQGHKVDYEVKVNYGDKSNPLRPTSFEPRITVDGQSYHLESNLKKIYNNLDISKVDKMKITVNEKYDSAKTNMIESNKFGKEGALIAGGLTLTTSIAEDLKLVINGEMQIEDMAVDVVQDTVTAGGLGYLEGFAEGTICTAMRKSGSKLITGLAKTGIPGMTIDFGIKSYDSISNYIEGNIDEFELIYDLGENVTTTIAGFETAQIGATLGSGLGPAGTISGGLIGGMVGYCISSELYVAAIDAGADGLEFFGEKANEFGKYCVDVATEHIPDFVGDVASSLNEFATEFELPFHF